MGEWYITRRGRGLYTRSVALPLWARFFVPCTLLQSAILIGVNVAIGILSDDCLTSLILGISSLVTLFMCYFAIEAVRTENSYQYAPGPLCVVACVPSCMLELLHHHVRCVSQPLCVCLCAGWRHTSWRPSSSLAATCRQSWACPMAHIART